MRGHIETLKQKPEHVRHQIALLTAFSVTGLVTMGWLAAMATSGTFALNTTPAEEVPVVAQETPDASTFSNLMGAAGAAFGATSTDPDLTIVDSKTSSTLDANAPMNASDKTVIPF